LRIVHHGPDPVRLEDGLQARVVGQFEMRSA
jgi:hypothetical protein